MVSAAATHSYSGRGLLRYHPHELPLQVECYPKPAEITPSPPRVIYVYLLSVIGDALCRGKWPITETGRVVNYMRLVNVYYSPRCFVARSNKTGTFGAR